MAKLVQQELTLQPFCIRFSYLLIVNNARGVHLSHLTPASPQCCAEALLALGRQGAALDFSVILQS